MTVYLDDWRQPARLGRVQDRWSHLIADTDEELHAFAARMGMRREWFQHRPHRPHQAHYDVPDRARREALVLGAVPVSWREVGRMMRLRRRLAIQARGADARSPGTGEAGHSRVPGR